MPLTHGIFDSDCLVILNCWRNEPQGFVCGIGAHVITEPYFDQKSFHLEHSDTRADGSAFIYGASLYAPHA
jgi:hypothetical protein